LWKYTHRNMNVGRCAVPFLGIFVSNFRYCVFAMLIFTLGKEVKNCLQDENTSVLFLKIC
jgi:hypothetical protein